MRHAVYATLAAALAVTAPFAARADDKDVIEYRQHAMKTLQEQTAIIGEIVSGAVPADNLPAHAEAIALAAQISAKSFDAKIPGGETKPEVWTKWADFSKRMSDFAAATRLFADTAKKGASLGEMTSILTQALPCKECHDIYRQEK
ncbi:MAG: cytochrome c [Rhodospirillaceae bacterium]|nr:cytochrome c [Rhodospirillaceae bacterium]